MSARLRNPKSILAAVAAVALVAQVSSGAGKKPLPEQLLPTNELDAVAKDVVHKAYPATVVDNVSLTRDFGMGGENLLRRAVIDGNGGSLRPEFQPRLFAGQKRHRRDAGWRHQVEQQFVGAHLQ